MRKLTMLAMLVGALLAMGSPWAMAQDNPLDPVSVQAPEPEPELAPEAPAEAPEPAPEPEQAAEPVEVPEPEPEPTLTNVYTALTGAIQSSAGSGAEVGLASDALTAAEQALADAQTAHDSAMGAQGDADAAIRAAAQAFVDFLTATYLQ